MDQDIKLKAVLYAIPLFLTPFADKIISILFTDKWPSIPMVVGCTLLGIIASSLGLRMYFDGSYERSKTNGNGVAPGQTQPH
jgi:drug/metabolite transporter (DMT)-like permease